MKLFYFKYHNFEICLYMNTILNVGWRLMLCTFPQLVGLGHNSVYSLSPEQFETQFKTKYAVEVDDVFFPDQLDLNFPLFKQANNKKENSTEIELGKPKKKKRMGWMRNTVRFNGEFLFMSLLKIYKCSFRVCMV